VDVTGWNTWVVGDFPLWAQIQSRKHTGGLSMKKAYLLLALACAFLTGCTGGSQPIALTLNFSGTQGIDNSQTVNITVTVMNDKNGKGAMWTLTGPGALANQTTSSVTYNAPASGTGTATLTATSVADATKSVSLMLAVAASPAITTTALANGIVGTAYNQTVAVTGGGGALTFSLVAGSGVLPAGLSLNSGTGAITGTPTAVGTSNFTVKVTDSSIGGAQSTTKALSITVNQAPAITSANNVTFVVSTAGTFTVTTTGTPTPSLAETGALPSGVTFTDNGNGTGTLSGTPAPGTAANYPIMFTATNGVGTAATQNFTLTVGQPAAITSAAGTTFTVGTAGTFAVTTTGFPKPSLTETGALPGGVTFVDNGNGSATLSGTPAANTGGTYPITVKAHNGIGTDAMQSFTLTVDQTPAITSANKTTFTVSTAGTFSVTASGFPTPAITETGALPSGVTFVDNGNGTGTLAGVPAPGTVGNYPITFTPSNGVGSPASQSFTLTVGQAPAITSGTSTTFTVGAAGTFSVTTTGFPAPSLTETGALPSGVTFVDNGNGTGTLAGTPAANTGKTYSITFTASNGVGSNATQSFTLTVDQAPAITSGNSATFSVGAAGTFTVTTSGFPAPSLTETGTLPSGVTFVDNGNGTGKLSGTPASGTAGSYPITFTASNGVGSNATQNFTLTVNTAPVITSANSTTFTVGAAGSFTVTTTGTPTPTLAETGALPSGVTFVDNGNGTGTLSGTPAAGTGKTYAITFTATNAVGSNPQSFTLTVDQAPAITSANSTTFTVGTSSSFTVMTTGFPVSALTETGALPSGVTFVDNGNGTGTLSGTPASGTAAVYPLNFTANNGVGTPAAQSFTLTVNTAPVITSGTSSTFTVGTPGTFTVTTTGSPTPTLTETGSLPSGVTFTDNGNGTATLAGTPATNSGGTYSITIKATSASGNTSQSFTLTVDEAPVITSNNSTTFTVGGAGSFQVTTTGTPTPSLTETGTLPSGVTFVDNGNGTGSLSGTPATGTAGSYPIVFTATNGVGTPATQNFTLTVSPAPTCTTGGSEAMLNGNYAFLLKGFDNSGNPALVGGVLTFNGSGSVTAGTIDLNGNATNGISSNTVAAGSIYHVGADQRGCMMINTAAGAQNYRLSLANISGGVASTAHVINFDSSGPFTSGIMRKQSAGSFSNASVNGTFAFGGSSIQNSGVCNSGTGTNICGGKFGVVGIITFNGSGGISGGSEDINQNGFLDGTSGITSYPATSPINFANTSTYSISSNGRGTLTLTFTSFAGTAHAMLYAVSSSDAFFMTSDSQTSNTIIGGEALKQSGTPFTTTPLSGNYIGYQSSLGNTPGDSATTLLLITPSGGNISGTQLRNDSGTFSRNSISATYSVTAAGRMTIPASGGNNNPPIFYLVSSSQLFILDAGSNAATGFFQSQSGSPFTNSSASGTYAFGTIDPEAANSSVSLGVAVFTPANPAGSIQVTNDDNGSGSQNLGQSQTFSYTVDSTGLGLIPASGTSCSITVTPITCQTAFYIISPTKAVVMDLQSNNPKIQLADK
jgi:hypothetical protein